MPIYEYECRDCGAELEAYVTSAFVELVCPKMCGGTMRRVLSLPAPHQVGGVEGKLAAADKIKRRNDAYHASPKGREEQRANMEAARKRGLPV